MFRCIEPTDLHFNRKYKIVGANEYCGIFIGKLWFGNNIYLKFTDCHALQSKLKSTKYFLTSRNYYEFVTNKMRIQSDMERRAVNLIIRRLIGDDCFEW